ncbi:CidA/LrgA family protein [Undibacterium sp. 5I1]|uniref:CidA/LrgA family protein n=1 Tax=unclassified Undibacterium TaxID=2630295 RepID=UPI002AB4BAB2|nr:MULTISPECIES: CidA/LrgA family protein [unclassified Undibacterium]MDY7538876.1 CidA/LrgA family protein [Undibacterium sp. 5I1]MEB0231002.1 CidA/LrgA family protein [Undibacterium sp. 10I3]MEB0257815.1 CidA/LrgA family protein [Undibacterium sp. 5I1]
MIQTFTILLIFQCLGEGVVYVTALPIPGPVVGMLLLFFFLLLKKDLAQKLAPTVQEFLRHLSLLFIPAGVGIMVYGQRVLDEWFPLVLALLISTALSIVVTAVVVRWLQK